MIQFALAVAFLIITPGPGVLSVAGVGAGFGLRAGARYIAGLFVGTNLVAIAVVSGLWAAVSTVPYLRTALLFVSVAFLTYLALRIAFAGASIAFNRALKQPGAADAVFLQFVNPKAYAVNTTLFAGFPMGFTDPATEIAMKFLIMNLIWVPVHFGWLWLGITIKRLDLPACTQRRINYLMAVAMMAVVAMTLLAGGIAGA
ncbi:MAG: lysine transporter LysE [Rhizobiales bacterium NRL2]|jgi:threonine/homoserine/homoserine lactone efflux protein|nr:MAG: lysine transporter LysE [Rhizobiales bacterium NRL2]